MHDRISVVVRSVDALWHAIEPEMRDWKPARPGWAKKGPFGRVVTWIAPEMIQ